jgi:uncharacterized membrane protein
MEYDLKTGVLIFSLLGNLVGAVVIMELVMRARAGRHVLQAAIAEISRNNDDLDRAVRNQTLFGVGKELHTMSLLDDAIADLKAKVEAETNTTNAAILLINGIQARIDAAVEAATAAGATAEQLAELTALSASLQTETDALGNAVAANTVPENPNP